MKKPPKPPATKALVPKAPKPNTYVVSMEKAGRALAAAARVDGATHRRVTKEEVDRARAIAEEAGNDRLRILIDLCWLTGARISELLMLQVKDIDLPAKLVSMPTLKRNQKKHLEPKDLPRRGIPLPVGFLGPIVVYLNTHKLVADDLLIGWKRTKAWEALHEVLLKAGVDEERAFPHAFRHGHAIHALKNGVPINVVQLTLGHTSVLTTQQYVRATGKDIAHSYERIDW